MRRGRRRRASPSAIITSARARQFTSRIFAPQKTVSCSRTAAARQPGMDRATARGLLMPLQRSAAVRYMPTSSQKMSRPAQACSRAAAPCLVVERRFVVPLGNTLSQPIAACQPARVDDHDPGPERARAGKWSPPGGYTGGDRGSTYPPAVMPCTTRCAASRSGRCRQDDSPPEPSNQWPN